MYGEPQRVQSDMCEVRIQFPLSTPLESLTYLSNLIMNRYVGRGQSSSKEDFSIRIVDGHARSDDRLISLCVAFVNALKQPTPCLLDFVQKTMQRQLSALDK